MLSVLAASGCSLFGPDEISGSDVAKEIGGFFRTAAGSDAKSLKCDAVEAESGAKTACTAIDRNDEKWLMTAVVKTVDGDRITYDTTFDDKLADNAQVQKSIARALQNKTGGVVQAVECTGIQKLAVNAFRTCTAVESNGARWEVEHHLTNLDGASSVTLKDTLLYAKSVESVVSGLARNLSQHFGLSSMNNLSSLLASSGSCANMLRGNPGDSIQCKAVLADKSSTDVTVRTTKSEDGKIYFELFPNNDPDLSMSGWRSADPS
ncbi:DUF4333 domain-containing protein [Nocardia jejuensis]|uniref:DUF4333 domain-containing protein n=1 Tax=Nocardia jejuensis TaxID=328049 RepID=UPI00082FAA62|nr:DUF4333 domain-containing protein [Nocardia jejuensis]